MSKDYGIDNEFWLDNPRYNNYCFKNHQVSSHGRVRNKKRLNVLKPIIDKDGYERLSIGSVDNVPVHRLVCQTFLGPPPEENMQVNHIDADRTNNHCLNLEWVSCSDNIKWGVYKGNINPYRGLERAIEANSIPVRIVETGEEFSSIKDCADYLGVSSSTVRKRLCNKPKLRNRKTLHEFHVEYISSKEEF